MSRTLTMDEAKSHPLEELLREIDATQVPVRVILEDGHEVEIKPAPTLKPLLTYDGYVPEGWKDAIYEPKRGA
jgi:hypothetical protein